MITSVSTKLKKTVKPLTSKKPATDEETLQRKVTFLDILDKARDEFSKKLKKGEVKLSSTVDLERMIKLTLLVSGEAETIKGRQGTEETQTTASTGLSIANVEDVLDVDDELVKTLYNKLLEGYNDINDEAGKE